MNICTICNAECVPDYWMNHFEGEEFICEMHVCGSCIQKVLGCSYTEFINAGAGAPPSNIGTNVTTDEQTYRDIFGYDVTITTRIETTITMCACAHLPNDEPIFISNAVVIDKILAAKDVAEKNETACD